LNPIIVPRQWRALLPLAVVLWGLPLVMRNDYLLLLCNVMALNAMVVLGLNLLIASTGQVSLGHAAFYGLGAYLSAIASTTWQWPLFAALAFAAASVAVIAFLLALPTLKLEGHYLVMATLGFNIIVFICFNQMESVTGGPSGFSGIPRLALGSFALNTDLRFYVFIWTLFLVAFALTLNLLDSRLGRALKAIHQKELTAEVLGIPARRYKIVTFVLSTVYAAVAGFSYAHYVTFISPKTFDIFYSVQIVTMVAVGGMGSLWGGLAGTILLTALPELLHHFEDLHVLLYGLILMGVLVFCPQGLLPALKSLLSARLKTGGTAILRPAGMDRPPGSVGAGRGRNVSAPFPAGHPAGTGMQGDLPALKLSDISLDFGGLQALNQVGFDIPGGRVVALIGPNGAGKTTLLNVVSGLLRPRNGQILLRDRSLIGKSPCLVAREGIGRTFQAVQIFQDFTVLDNLLLGYHLQGHAGFLAGYLHTRAERREEAVLRDRALEHLDDFGLAEKAHSPAQQLSLLEQKLLELARALALSPSILLLDEPVGGLNPLESEVLVETISSLRERGIGVLLVEHDMNVVMQLSDRIEVLQHGNRIASGPPREIRQDPRVIAAYLGTRRR